MAIPYRIEGPALISFSGGRTSAFMLHQILEAHDGQLPDGVIVAFANTGKEREATLRFVHECATNWNVKIRWLEFVTDLRSVGASGRFEEVGYNSASRNGEPLSRLIARKQSLFSTMSGRWCTQYCKVLVLQDFMETQGYSPGKFTEVIGLRADESDRIYELPRRALNEGRNFAFPLSKAGVRKADVIQWWKSQPFDLVLPRGTGNCDHCPFVGEKSRIARARINPDGLDWWQTHESERDFSFGYMSVAEIREHIANNPVLIPLDEIETEAADSECGTWCPSEAA